MNTRQWIKQVGMITPLGVLAMVVSSLPVQAGTGSTGDCNPPNVQVRCSFSVLNNTGEDANDFHFTAYQNDRPSVVVTGAIASSPSCNNVNVTLGNDNGTPSPPPGNHSAAVDMTGCDIPNGSSVPVEVILCMNERNCVKIKDVEFTKDGEPLGGGPLGGPPQQGFRVRRPIPGGGGGGRPGQGAQQGGGGAGNWIHMVCIENDDTRWLVLDRLQLLASMTYYASLSDIDWSVIPFVTNAAGEPPVCIPPGGSWCYPFETTGAYLGGHVYMNYSVRVALAGECDGSKATPEEDGDDNEIPVFGDHPVDDVMWEVMPGYDLWLTEQPTDLTFGLGGDLPAIPADFFGPGSDPFEGQVAFRSLPVLWDGYVPVDTVIERLDEAELPAPGSTDVVPIEMVELSLQSVDPIVVQVAEFLEPGLFDVQAADTTSAYPPGPPLEVLVGGSDTGVPLEDMFVSFLNPHAPLELMVLMTAADSGGPIGQYGPDSFFDVFVQEGTMEQIVSFGMGIEIQEPGGGGILYPMTFPRLDWVPPDSFFDITYDVKLPDGSTEKHTMHWEIPAGVTAELTAVRVGTMYAGDSFFDVFVDITLLGPIDPAIPILHCDQQAARYFHVDSFFDVFVEIDRDHSALGNMNITRLSDFGGEFTSELEYTPLVSFEYAGGGPEYVGSFILGGTWPLHIVNQTPYPWTYAPWACAPPMAGPNFFPSPTSAVPHTWAYPAGGQHTTVPAPAPPTILRWMSMKVHGGIAEWPIFLDPLATTSPAVTVEPRQGGVQELEVDFDMAVQLVGPIVALDVVNGINYAASAVNLINGARTLEIIFDPPLPNAACYRVDLAGSIQNTCSQSLAGDPDCMVVGLEGDVNDSHSTNLIDGAVLKVISGSVGYGPGDLHPKYDLNLSNSVNLLDFAWVKVKTGSVSCN